MGSDYSENEVEVTVENGTVKAVKLVNFGDTPSIGELATTDEALAAYEGATADSEVDAVSGATFTSKSVASMVKAALESAAE